VAKHEHNHVHQDGHGNDSGSDSSGEESSNIDFSKITGFFSNKKRAAFLFTVLLLLIPVILTFYIRLQPQYLSQASVWAESSVNNYFRNQFVNQVNQQYPNLPQQNKDALINQQYAEFQKNNKAQLDQQVTATADYFKSGFRYQENNVTYTFLGDLDSYFFLRQARNLVQKGTICDEIRDGQCWDNHMYAPLGVAITGTLHPYGIFYLYHFFQIFNSKINLMQTAFLMPTILAALAAIAAFFVGRRVMNEIAGFFAAMFLALSPMFLSRTLGSDTDIWNIMFSVIVFWAFIEAFEAKSLLKKGILAAVTALLIGFFSFAWTGWWYILDLILASVIGYLIFMLLKNYIKHKSFSKIFSEDVKHTLIVLLVLFFGTAIFVSLFMSPATFTSSFADPVSRFLNFKVAANPSLWPNVITTVAEMNAAGLDTIVSQTSFGMSIFFSLALLGIVFTLIKKEPEMKEYLLIGASLIVFLFLISRTAFNLNPFIYIAVLMLPLAAGIIMLLKDKETKVDIKPAILLTAWFVGSILASTKGVRFVLLAAPPFAVGLGVTIGYVHQLIARSFKAEKINELLVKVVLFVVLVLLILMPFNDRMPYKIGLNAAKTFIPSMTKGWWDGLLQIRDQSKPDAIINSWWDFGHWFKYVADRAVTLDGASQNHPNAHWLGRILQTDNETEAVGILRMLDCGSNNAFDEVNKRYNDTEISQNIVRELTLRDKTDSAKYLASQGFSSSEIDAVLKYSHCDPPEDFFITSEDMVGKAGVWAHFGQWDFDKAFIINNLRSKNFEEATAVMKQRWNYSEEKATSIYYEVQALQSDKEMNDWISPWPNYLTGNWVSCKEVGGNTNDNTTNATENPLGHSLLCAVGYTLGQNTNGDRTSLDGIVIDLNKRDNSSIIVGSYDAAGSRRGAGKAVPSSFIFMDNDTIKKVSMQNVTLPFDVVVDLVNQRILVADPLLSQSMFTKLFYLEGRYTTHFEKFYDQTDITGTRIIIWKVKW
jgi:asparagine N-glycosylation enzyme membrane subunit Stt3